MLAAGGDSGTGTFRRYDPLSSKKFKFKGRVELVYRNYTTESSYRGHTVDDGWTTFEQIYRLELEGYIYHPRLALFSASISYSKQNTDTKETSDEMDSKGIMYDFSTIFFPLRPISLQVYGSRISTSMDSAVLSTNDVTSTNYGAILFLQHRKYPLVKLQYEHWDTTVERTFTSRIINEDYYDYGDIFGGFDEESPYVIVRKRVKDKTKMNRYRLEGTGDLKFIRTRYFLSAALSDFESPFRQYTAVEMRTSTYTVIKEQTTLATHFQYNDYDFYKLLSFSTNLNLAPIYERFYQTYGYEFTSSETPEKIDSHTMRATWRYRYAARIHGAADFRYRLEKQDNDDNKSYDASISANYGRPIKAYDFSSGYFFSTGQDELKGEFTYMTNKFTFRLATKKVKPARLYTTYYLTYRTLDYAPDIKETGASTGKSTDIEQVLTFGAKGRGPKRISWTVELEGRFLDSTEKEVTWRSEYYGEDPYGQKIRHYTLTGEMASPVLRRGAVRLKASYTMGTSNSEAVRKYFYEARFRYPLLRNLALTALIREDWRNAGWWAGTRNISKRNYDWRIRDYEIICNYFWGRTVLSLEYFVTETEEGPARTLVSSLYLRASRRF